MRKTAVLFFLIIILLGSIYINNNSQSIVEKIKGYSGVFQIDGSQSYFRTLILSANTFPKSATKLKYSIWNRFPPIKELSQDRIFNIIKYCIYFLYIVSLILYFYFFKETLIINILSIAGFMISGIFIIIINKRLYDDKVFYFSALGSLFILFLMLLKNLVYKLKEYVPKYRPAALLVIIINFFAVLFFMRVNINNDLSCYDSYSINFHRDEKLFVSMPVENGKYFVLLKFIDSDGNLVDWMIKKVRLNTDFAICSPAFKDPFFSIGDYPEIPCKIYNTSDKKIDLSLDISGKNLDILPQRLKLELPVGNPKTLFLNIIPKKSGKAEINIDSKDKNLKWDFFVGDSYNTSYYHDEDNNIISSADIKMNKSGLDLIFNIKNKCESEISFSILLPRLPGLRFLMDEDNVPEKFTKNLIFSNFSLKPDRNKEIVFPFGKIADGDYFKREIIIFYFCKDNKKYNSLRVEIPSYSLGKELSFRG